MNTRKLRKAIMTLCAALLLVSLSVGITVAYLTDTQSVTNTFTVGNVGITLDEADVYDEDDDVAADKIGTAIPGAERVAANDYNLIPGHTYDKDPTITVNAGSQDCYVMAKVTVKTVVDEDGAAYDLGNLIPNGEDRGLIAFGDIVTGGVFELVYENDNSPRWENYGGDADAADDLVYENDDYKLIQLAGNGTARYFYIFAKKPQAAGKQVVLFENLVIPGEWDHEQMAYLNGLTIDVDAYAVQAEGFADTATEGLTDAEMAIAAGFGDVFEKKY